jgi:hypothetical protein
VPRESISRSVQLAWLANTVVGLHYNDMHEMGIWIKQLGHHICKRFFT